MYKISKYNYWVKNNEEEFIFNTLHSSLVKIPHRLKHIILNVNSLSENDKIKEFLKNAGVVIKSNINEIDIVRERLQEHSHTLKITIAPTLNCNLNCFYCYQGDSKGQMNLSTCDKILNSLEKNIIIKKYKSVFVDWYGGEPLLAVNVIRYFSDILSAYCLKNNVEYQSSIVTNGTLLNEENIKILQKAKINNIQITLDGNKEIHDKYRPFKNGKGSFDLIFENIKSAIEYFNINLRINVDKQNIDYAYLLLEEFDKNNLLKNIHYKLIPYISPIGKLSESCSYTMSDSIEDTSFYDYALIFQNHVLNKCQNIRSEEVFELPKKLRKACGAQDPNSICIDPFGNIFKCGLELHDLQKGCGKIWDNFEENFNYRKWVEYNPLNENKCLNCVFLPICLGGCKKYIFDKNPIYQDESCQHWNDFFEKILINYIRFKNGS